jgi:proline dehydrogenase
VAGESLDMACMIMNLTKASVTIDYLGNSLKMNKKQKMAKVAEGSGDTNELIHSIPEADLDGLMCPTVVMKTCEILDEARAHRVFVTLDMEDFPRCQPTLDVFKNLKSEYNELGTVIQAYLYREEGC